MITDCPVPDTHMVATSPVVYPLKNDLVIQAGDQPCVWVTPERNDDDTFDLNQGGVCGVVTFWRYVHGPWKGQDAHQRSLS